MKFPYSMLLDFVRTDLGPEQVAELLTMAGLEVEGIDSVEDEAVIDVKVMSNRGDALSVYGLSREVLAKDTTATPTELYHRAAARFSGGHRGKFELTPEVATIEAEDCNRFACRTFAGVPGAAPSPEAIQSRLRKVGMRPISLLVDLTNYVMLELGQPLHAFDRDKLRDGRIVVRHARPGEELTTLNGERHELAGQMMICDAERPVGVPGVMGGLETEVTAHTTHVLLESAHFRSGAVRRTRNQLGLSTEASYRFERSVDPDGVVAAITRFTELLAEAVPGLEFSNVVDHFPRPPDPRTVRLRVDRASRLLGMEIPPPEARAYLQRLGFETEGEGSEFSVSVPSWRPDVVREEDLVEELGRVHGYEKIPERLPAGTTTLGGATSRRYLAWDLLREAAVRAGFVQIVGHTLRSLHPLDAAGELGSRLSPRVVASPEHAYLRNSLLPTLADAAHRNGGRNLHLFEIGKVFWRTPGEYLERRRISLLATGDRIGNDRKEVVVPQEDYFSLKGALETILGAVDQCLSVRPSEEPDPRFHPTRQAQPAGGYAHGILGQLHPDIAEALNLPSSTYLAEIEIDEAWFEGPAAELVYRRVSRNPAVRRDLAVLIEKAVPYESVASAIRRACGEVLERQWLFDIFEGVGIPAGKHSLGIGLQLRKASGNFTDEEANQVRDAAVAALAELGATMR